MFLLLIRLLLVFASLNASVAFSASPIAEETIKQILIKEDFYNSCLHNDIETNITELLSHPGDLSDNKKAILLYAQATQATCHQNYELNDSSIDKILELPKENIVQSIYVAALVDKGIALAISNSGEECEYFNQAKKLLDTKTNFNTKALLIQWDAVSCEKGGSVVTLRRLYSLLEQLNDDNNAGLKSDTLNAMAMEYAKIGQNSTAAKLRKESMKLSPEKENNYNTFIDYYNLATDYLDAGDVVEANNILKSMSKVSAFHTDNNTINSLILVLQAKIAYAKKDYTSLMYIMDEMHPMMKKLEAEYNTNRMSILRALACLKNNRDSCVYAFMVDIDKYLSHQKDGNDTWLLSFLINYYTSRGDADNALFYFEKYEIENNNKLLRQQESATILGVAQLHHDVVEMNLGLTRSKLRESHITTWLVAGISITAIFFSLLLWRMKNQQKYFAETDLLTNISNRRAILRSLDCISEPQSGKVHALVLFDLDKFKIINDIYGHSAGDLMIKHVADKTQYNIRSNDDFGRIGGEEFLICLKNLTKNQARESIERIRKSLESSHITFNGNDLSITASFSLCFLDKPIDSFEDIYQHLDKGLYAAKDAGRNTIIEI